MQASFWRLFAKDEISGIVFNVSQLSRNSLYKLLLILFIIYFVWNSLYFFPYTIDDAFISLRYAENLVNGKGLVYNPGQRIEGFSNFLWVIFEALILLSGFPILTSLKVLGIVSGIGVVLLVRKLADHLFAGQSLKHVKILLTVGLLCFNTSLAVWSQAGLETVFFTLLIVAMSLRFEIELQCPQPIPWSAVLFALAWMTRPEAPVYTLYFVARRLSEIRQRQWSNGDLWWCVTAGALIVPYELWGIWYFGRLLPMTHDAKIGTVSGRVVAAVINRNLIPLAIERFLTLQGWGFPALLSLAAIGCVIGRKRLRATTWMVPLCGLAFILYARQDWMPRHRLFVSMLPFIFLLVGYGLGELYRVAARSARVWVLVWWLVCGIICFDYAKNQMIAPEPLRPVGERTLARQGRDYGWFFSVPTMINRRDYELEELAVFILANVPPGEYVCLRDIGFPGFLSMNPICDTAGLISPVFTRARHDSSQRAQEAMFDEILSIRPGCIRLVLMNDQPYTIDAKINSWLQTNPTAKALYAQNGTVFRTKHDRRIVVYLREDLPKVDYADRMRMLLTRFPEYEHSTRLKLTP